MSAPGAEAGECAAPRGSFRLRDLPFPLRLTLAIFALLVGAGYGFAVANIVASHQMADGVPGLSLNDLRVVFAGGNVARSGSGAVPSRMLQMLEGAMRQYVSDDAEFAVLRDWLAAGAPATELDAAHGERSAERTIILNCLRCHAADSGEPIGRKSPFGPDQLTVAPQMIAPFLPKAATGGAAGVEVEPQPAAHLILITHAHMLAIPVFTLIVAGLFSAARFPSRVRAAVLPAPMAALAVDFSSWWLARAWPGAIYLIAVAGAVFGVAFAAQLLAVLVELVRPARRRA